MAAVKPRRRSRPRVEDTEASSKVVKSTKHRETTKPTGVFEHLSNGEVGIVAQLSELVPVAQYASVTIGPVQLAWKLGGVDMEVLADVDWSEIEDDDDLEKVLTKEQLAVFKKVRASMRGTMMLLEFTVAEDREIVERSIAQHNEREKEDSKKRGPNSR